MHDTFVIIGIAVGISFIARAYYVWEMYSTHKSFHIIDYSFSHIYDNRSSSCSWCTKHSWDLWAIDMCKCKRCATIKSLENDIFGDKPMTAYEKNNLVITLNELRERNNDKN